MSMQRILQGTPATITAYFPNQDGEPRAVTSATLQLTDSAGVVVVEATAANVDLETHYVSFTLTTAATANLDWLTATWTANDGSTVTKQIEVVGGYYFTLAEARANQPSLQQVTKYPDDDLIRVRQEVEQECETITGRSFVPRFGRLITRDGDYISTLRQTPDLRRIRSFTLNGQAYAQSAVDQLNAYFIEGDDPDLWSSFHHYGNYSTSSTVIAFEYGLDSPPADLKPYVIKRLRQRVMAGSSGDSIDRATSLSTPDGTFSLFTPGLRGAELGDPEINQAYRRYSLNRGDLISVPIR